jgi:hypothetical protein
LNKRDRQCFNKTFSLLKPSTTTSNIQKFHFLPSACNCVCVFLWMSAETVIIPVHNINWLLFVAHAVYLVCNEVNFRRSARPWLRRLVATLPYARPCAIYGRPRDSRARFAPSTSVFQCHWIPPTFRTHIQFNNTLTRRTSGRRLGNFILWRWGENLTQAHNYLMIYAYYTLLLFLQYNLCSGLCDAASPYRVSQLISSLVVITCISRCSFRYHASWGCGARTKDVPAAQACCSVAFAIKTVHCLISVIKREESALAFLLFKKLIGV